MTVRNIFEISEDDHPLNTPTPLVTHARDHWWTLDFANAFVFPGVNSRGELVPSPRAYARNGAPRVGSGIKILYLEMQEESSSKYENLGDCLPILLYA
jgi:hypothetical protein